MFSPKLRPHVPPYTAFPDISKRMVKLMSFDETDIKKVDEHIQAVDGCGIYD